MDFTDDLWRSGVMGAYAGPTQSWGYSNLSDNARFFASTKLLVKSGLVLNLDAGVLSSYPGSGTAWTDLSGNGNNGTLTNGPTYSSANGGSIVFDGIDDYINLGLPSSLNALFGTNKVSVDVWLRRSGNISGQKIIFDSGEHEYIHIDAISNQLSFAIGTPSVLRSARSATLDLDVWYNYVGVYDGTNITTYLNSTQNSQVAKSGNISADSGFLIGSYTYGFYFPGRISSVKVYNKALTAAEIQQNYLAIRSRFGV